MSEKTEQKDKKPPNWVAARAGCTIEAPPPTRGWTVEMKPHDYQPSKAEYEQEFDMPGLSESEAFEAFFQPIRAIHRGPDAG